MPKRKVIRIVAKKDGFRRCGVAHRDTPTDYEIGHWSEEQLEILRSEPDLLVAETEVEDDTKAAGSSGGKGGGKTA